MSSSVRPTWDSAAVASVLRAHQFKAFVPGGMRCKAGCVVESVTLSVLGSVIEADHQAEQIVALFAGCVKMIEQAP